MPSAAQPSSLHSNGRTLLAWIVVVLTVVAVWTFVDYRTKPPPTPKAVTSDE